jgi:aminoglycoside phosphotransferase (APT) family kinase protein
LRSGPHTGFDPTPERLSAALVRFLKARGIEILALGPFRRLAAGLSWHTYAFVATWRDHDGRLDRRDLILRLGDPRGMLAPYTAACEFAALRALATSSLPVPEALWWSDTDDEMGAPFLVLSKLAGEAPDPWTAQFGEADRSAIGAQFIGLLAALHDFEWQGTEAASLPGPRSMNQAAECAIASWEERFRRFATAPWPTLERALIWLRSSPPPARRISLVHGDYRIGNFLIAAGRISAILDWELAHRGDPYEDLGWLCLKAFRGRSPFMSHLVTRETLLARHSMLTGIPPDAQALHYWEAFGGFKLSIIHLGAMHCLESGRSHDMRMAAMAAQLPRVLLQLSRTLESAP